MPHQCTSCERLLPSGSREMLGGCPQCGCNRFQYIPEDATTQPDSTDDPAPNAPNDAPDQRSATDGGDLVIASDSEPPDTSPERTTPGPEGDAQADARSSVVDPTDLPPADHPVTTAAPDPTPEEQSESPPIDELTEELEEAFGSIRIVERGEYELNLMELYENDACIIQLEEDGRYVIDVPDMFEGPSARG